MFSRAVRVGIQVELLEDDADLAPAEEGGVAAH